MTSRDWVGTVLSVLLVFSVPGAGHAQEESASYAKARQLFEEATAAYDTEDYVLARSLYSEAHALEPGAPTLRALGFCDYRLKHYARAIDELQQALDDTRERKMLTQDERVSVTETLETSRRFVGKLVLDTQPTQLELTVDEREVHETTLQLDAGAHTLTASAPGYQSVTISFVIFAQQEQRIAVRLPLQSLQPVAAAQSVVPVISAPQRNPKAQASSSVLRSWWFWAAAAGVVAAGTVTTTILVTNTGGATPTSTNVRLQAP